MIERVNKTIEKHLGKKLKMYRIINGYSIDDIAILLDISHQQLHKYEQGVNRISATRLNILSEKLKVPLHLFFRDQIHLDLTIDVITEQDCALLKSFKSIDNQPIQQCLKSFIDNFATVLKNKFTND